MKAPAETTWTCPECGERIPVPFSVKGRGRGRSRKAVVSIEPTAIADAVAHAWTHTERA